MSRQGHARPAEALRQARKDFEAELSSLRAELRSLRKRVELLEAGKPPLSRAANTPRQSSSTAGSQQEGAGSNLKSRLTASAARLNPDSIRAFRKRLGLSQAELAQLAGVTPVAVYFWEAGRTTPRGRSVKELCRIRKLGKRAARSAVDQLDS